MQPARERAEVDGSTTRSVLIIDDEADIREVAQLGLELVGGWHVETAADGIEGVEHALTRAFDAILLDVMMPAVDGPETLLRLQREPATAEVPVVFVTARGQLGDLAWLEGLGARGVIRKPFDPTTLAIELARILGWPDFSC